MMKCIPFCTCCPALSDAGYHICTGCLLSDTVCTYAQGMRMHRPDVDPFHHIFIERDVAGWEALDACLERTERLLQAPAQPARPGSS